MILPAETFLQGEKYKIIRFISSGGFGCTYEAEHTVFKKRVAIKEFFMKEFCNRDEHTHRVTIGTLSQKGVVENLQRKFIDEATVLFNMYHPGIVRVIDTFEENGTAYYVMEYIEGTSLQEMVQKRGALPEQEALGYIRQVCDALSYVHGKNRLHLDIKPGNIMLNQEGRTILIDFGTSKHYDEKTGQNTTTLTGVHTPGYAPYEQIARTFTTFSPSTDIYALGATLYKLLTGVTPPDAGSLMAQDKVLAPLPESVSESTANAIYQALQPSRANRPSTIADFLRLLNGEQDNTVVTEQGNNQPPTPPTPPVSPEVPKKKSKKRGWLWAILIVLLLGGGAYLYLNQSDGETAREWRKKKKSPVDKLIDSIEDMAQAIEKTQSFEEVDEIVDDMWILIEKFDEEYPDYEFTDEEDDRFTEIIEQFYIAYSDKVAEFPPGWQMVAALEEIIKEVEDSDNIIEITEIVEEVDQLEAEFERLYPDYEFTEEEIAAIEDAGKRLKDLLTMKAAGTAIDFLGAMVE